MFAGWIACRRRVIEFSEFQEFLINLLDIGIFISLLFESPIKFIFGLCASECGN